MTAAPSRRWLSSSRRNPCPICGRDDAGGDCRISSDGLEAICHRGSTWAPPDIGKGQTITGKDGRVWAFTGDTSDGRAAHFTLDKPLDGSKPAPARVVPLRRKPEPAAIPSMVNLARLAEPWPEPPPDHLPDGHRLDYSPTQWTEIRDRGERPRHLLDGQTQFSAGDAPWPIFGNELIPQAAGRWIVGIEGPKCATWLQAGGLVGVSQPGHDHKLPSITRRFRDLREAGIAGMLYISDNDATGKRKAEQLAEAAAEAMVPFIHVPATAIWADLPAGGSVDDAPGTAAERVAAIEAAIPDAVRRQQQPQVLTLDDLLGPAEEGKLRRPRKDLLPRALEMVCPLRLNLLTQVIEANGKPIDGDYLGTLHMRLAEEHGLEVAKDRAIDTALLIARRNAYHPVRDYLNGLTQELDPTDWAAIDARCFGSEDSTGWSATHLQRQLIGLVARAMEPGCELHTCLVLASEEQGIGKSTFWKLLGGQWFSDSLGDLRDIREDRIQLHSAWIHEWGEIDAVIGKRESETLKRFISASRDDCRRPYGRGIERLERSCGLVGTTNRRDFMKDPSGNRRLPVIHVKSVDIGWVKANRDRIWGSAVAAYRRGERWWYTHAEGQLVSDHARAFSAEDPLRDAIETWAEDHPDVLEAPTVRILMDLGHGDQLRDTDLRRKASNAMTELGWRRTEVKRRYLLPNSSKTDKTWGWVRPDVPSAGDVPRDVPRDVPSQNPSQDQGSLSLGDMGTSDQESLGEVEMGPETGSQAAGNIRQPTKEAMSPGPHVPSASPPRIQPPWLARALELQHLGPDGITAALEGEGFGVISPRTIARHLR